MTRERMVHHPALFLVLSALLTAYVLIANGGLLPHGEPFGSDFISFWVAAREAIAGRVTVPYEAETFAAAQDALFPASAYYAFFYPPHYLALMAPFGLLPFYPALALWMTASFAAAATVLVAIAGHWRTTLLLAAAFPAAFLNLAHGQNAFLLAALFGGALLAMQNRHMVLAGVLFGLMTIKPQFGLLIPLALLAGGHWRTIVAATATTVFVALFSVVVLGLAPWHAFLAQSGDAVTTLQQGFVAHEKMISVYAMLRIFGLGHAGAMGLQLVVSIAAAITIAIAWRKGSGATDQTRAALLIVGSVVATPFALNYDLFLFAPAAAFLVSRGMKDGFCDWEKTALGAVFFLPVLFLILAPIGLPSVQPFLLAFLGVLVRRVWIEAGQHGEIPAQLAAH